MKTPIPLPIAELKPALNGLSKIINKRTTLPVMATVKIERTKDGWITLTGTDFDAFGTVRLEQPAAGEPASILIPLDELVKITKASGKTDTISVSSEETTGIISYPVGGQTVEHRCPSISVEEFPAIPRIEGVSCPLTDLMRTSMLEAFDFASTDETRYILNGICIDTPPEGNYVIGTNGRALYSSNSFKLPLKMPLVIPTSKFLLWREFHQDGQWLLTAGEPAKDHPGWLRIDSRRWTFISKQIEGNYPNWRQVVPSESQWNTRAELEGGKLEQIAQTIERLPCHDAVNHTIVIEVKDRRILLVAKPPQAERWTKVEIPAAKVTGRDVFIALNREYLASALRIGLKTIQIADAISPLRFSHEGRQLIVMCVRSGGDAPPQPPAAAKTQPAPAPEAEAQPQEENMPRTTTPPAPATNGNGTHAENGTNGHTENGNGHQEPQLTALESALLQIETIKGSLRTAKQGLNTLMDTLKQAQRDQRTSEKDVASVRSTLEKLQSVRL